MAIVKIGNTFRGSPSSHQMYEEEEEEENEAQTTTSGSSDSANTDTSGSVSSSSGSESDSAMGPDEADLDLTGPIEPGTDLCQVRDQTCTLPTELYDLNDLSDILSVDTWNNYLTEEERLALSCLLPDMDRETYAHTLSDLFEGKNFLFGNPMATLFTQLKGGLCDPRIILYRRGLNFLQKRKYYRNLQNYHNSMLGSLMEMRDAWESCKGYTVQEKLRLLDVMKTQKSLANTEKDEREFESDTDSQELEIYLKKKDNVKYGKGSVPEPLKIKDKVKGYGGHRNLLYDYPGKKMGVNQSVTVASFGPHSSENSKKGKHFDKREDLVSPKHHGKILQAAPLDRRSKVKILYKNNTMEMQSNQKGKMYGRSDETDSDSSGQLVGSEEACKSNYRSAKKEQERTLPIKREYSEISREVEPFSAKSKKKNKISEPTYAQEEVQLVKRVYVPVSNDKVKLPPVESYTLERKRKSTAVPAYVSQQVNSDNKASLSKTSEDLYKSTKLANNEGFIRKSAPSYGENLVPNPPLSSCSKKANGKVNVMNNNSNNNSMQMEKRVDPIDMQSGANALRGDINITKKKGKKKPDPVQEPVPVIPPEPALPEKSLPDPEPEPEKLVKKPPILITPTIHTGFSFSIIHLLSAVRKAMILPVEEDGAGTSMGPNLEKEQKTNLPSLTVQDIVNRVKMNPGDPFILETQEPLQDLVRGVLKILSSKTAPLGAKGWKQLVSYERSNKTWFWVGPVSPATSDSDPVEEDTSSDAWGIPHKMLVKLVDAFANWLKSGQETLQQIGSLPAPPASMLSCPNEKERFKDLRAQKSLNTISPSSDEVRTYFRKEEVLRYSIPDRAFSYTAADGKKSTVAPLRRGGGKPTSKARDHFMLKPDRPPHVTILCLVRDAAARLPGSIGTRADVCTLLRDSQYIVEDVSDAQVNQVVSGALDRLHYERDPCVQFDADRKLWVYLHREKEEEDFEDDGTSSTKKWKRPRKDGTDADSGAVVGGSGLDPDVSSSTGVAAGAGAGPGAGAGVAAVVVAGASVCTDLPVEKAEQVEIVCENVTPASKPAASGLACTTGPTASKGFGVGTGFGTSAGLGSGTKMLCRENSTNDDFDDADSGKERLFGAFLM